MIVAPENTPGSEIALVSTNVAQTFGAMPLYFVENGGQVDDQVAFTLQGGNQTIYFTPQGITFALTSPLRRPTDDHYEYSGRRHLGLPKAELRGDVADMAYSRWAVKLDFMGANQNVRPLGEEQLETIVSYFKGSPDEWHTGLRTFGRVVYHNLWPGIDLVYYSSGDALKYEFVVSPGSDPSQIQLKYSGATDVNLNIDGQLVVSTPIGGFTDDSPEAYQIVNDQRVSVQMDYELDWKPSGILMLPGESDTLSQGYGFQVGDYDRTRPLVLDPAVLLYAGYLGGIGHTWGAAIAVDTAGNVYATGFTGLDQGSFPVTVGPDLTFNGDADAFVAKINSAGTGLVYAGYIGGTGYDNSQGIAVDNSGNAYITGYTFGSQGTFPVIGGPDLSYNGGDDGFVAKINSTGTSLVYAGYIGGTGNELSNAIAVDSAGNAYVTGSVFADQASIPVIGGPFLTYGGGETDAFVAKVNSAGTGLDYAGYIGGDDKDEGTSIAVDAAGSAYITGYTESTEDSFPVINGPDLTLNGVDRDAFVVKVSPAGTGLTYAGYIGGVFWDIGYGIAVDSDGNAYITGVTQSYPNDNSFPVTVGPDLTHNGLLDAFVAKVNAAGTGLVYAGYIGGSSNEWGSSIAVDTAGNAYVTGWTESSQVSFPVLAGPDLFYDGQIDAFVVKVNAASTGLVFASYIGGDARDEGTGIAVDAAGNVYVIGTTRSDQASFPVVSGPDLSYNGGQDAFVTKIGAPGGGVHYSISGQIRDTSNNPVSSVRVTTNTGLSAVTDSNGNYTLTDVEAGTYTFSPSNNSYSFSPAYRTISVPPGAIENNFTAKVSSHSGNLPLVFVHGFGGFNRNLNSGDGCTEADQTFQLPQNAADEYFGPLDNLLAQSNDVFYARLVSNYCFTPTFDENVLYLMEAIDSAKEVTHQPKVILIAHSMGGLVSRAYIEGSQYRGDVEALFTIGTPHHGIPHDVLTFAANGLTAVGDYLFDWGSFCGDRQPGMCEFSETLMRDFNQQHQLRDDVNYVFLSGDAPTLSRNPIGLTTDAFFQFQPNDGIVGLSSGEGQTLAVGQGVQLGRYSNDENHNIFGSGALYDWPYFGPRWDFLTATDSKIYAECLKPVFVDRTQETCNNTSQAVGAALTEILPAAARTTLENGTLLSGQTATRTIAIDGGQALFTSLWQTGAFSLSVMAPGGLLIDPAFAAGNPTVVSYTASVDGAGYYFPNAQAGVWYLVTQAQTVPISGATYSTLAAFASSTTLAGGANKHWYSPGANAVLTATLGGFPISALVTATIDAAGITATVSLVPMGGGLYQGVYPVPGVPGYTSVQLLATGINSSSLPFEREAGFAFEISPGTFLPSGAFSDTPHPHIGLLSLYQALTVTVGVNAVVSGTLGLSADLVNGVGDFVAHTFTVRAVTTGTVNVALRFAGDDIYASARNGPYTLTNLLLTDQTGAALITAEASSVYTTAAYLVTSFASPQNLYLPFVRR